MWVRQKRRHNIANAIWINHEKRRRVYRSDVVAGRRPDCIVDSPRLSGGPVGTSTPQRLVSENAVWNHLPDRRQLGVALSWGPEGRPMIS